MLSFALVVVFFVVSNDADTMVETSDTDGSDTQWTDDLSNVQYTDTTDGASVTTWYNAISSSTQSSLVRAGSLTDSDSTPVLGWFTSTGDQGLRRAFQCSRNSMLEMQVDLLFCDGGSGDSQWKVVGQGVGLGFSYFSENFIFDSSSAVPTTAPGGDANGAWISAVTNLGAGSSVNGGRTCSGQFDAITFHDRLEIPPGPDYSYIVTFSMPTSVSASRPNALYNLKVRCTSRATPAPTRNPTGDTTSPTKQPTDAPTDNPTSNPTGSPTLKPTGYPTRAQPSSAPTTPIPSEAPTVQPTQMPTEDPTWRPTDEPSPSPTMPTARPTTQAPTVQRSVGNLFSAAFGGESECTDGWVACNIEVFIIFVVLGVAFVVYWILGGVWYKRRRGSRANAANTRGNVEMGGAAAPEHETADRWKSAFELEQEQKKAAQNDTANDW